jgi:peptide/nickel transport system permease protein
MEIWKEFKKNKIALFGLFGILIFIFIAVYAPLISNSMPLVVYNKQGLSFPFFYFLFAPDSPEIILDRFFNYFMFLIPAILICNYFIKKNFAKIITILVVVVCLSIPFILTKNVLNRTDWTEYAQRNDNTEFILFSLIPYGPYQLSGDPYEHPSKNHWFGTDHIGRDVLSRIIYGARVSFAVGIFATLLSLIIGTTIGLIAGYFGGFTDLFIMRIVEIIICFPAFLLLLILIATFMDLKFEQSVLIVIPVIGFLSWTGLSRIVRGEVLKQRSLPYIKSCEVFGMSKFRIMFKHILPNINGPIVVCAVFAIAANILAESGLSFLGFGVQPPTASWGEILKEAFVDPLRYWNLTLWPGLLLFMTILFFNLIGEGLRKAINNE